MPGGKARRDYADTYVYSEQFHPHSMVPLTGFRRRGGTHKVKDGDRTDSKYDDWNYTELVMECKEREVYIKDMKKAYMTKTLLQSDIKKEKIEKEAFHELEKRQQDVEDAKKRAEAHKYEIIRARHERNEKKRQGRERGEDVSEDEMDEDMIDAYHRELMGMESDDAGNMGYVLSDVSWDSTSTESTVMSMSCSAVSGCKLNLFEWTYDRMPALSPPQTPRAPSCTLHQDDFADLQPRHVPYAPLKITTTKSLEKLTLPGQTYPPGIVPDYVPVLSQQTRAAARNGVFEGVLRNAVIERASVWAERTYIQGWNGKMFFTLPPRSHTKKLVDVYRKYCLENRKLLRVKASVDTASEDRERRHRQRRKNIGAKTLEVYEAVECRPTAMCYLPAYLDCNPHCRTADELGQRRELHNLFFVRFPSCDVPHYYFWTYATDWKDPTIPNPAWYSVNLPHNQRTVREVESSTDELLEARNTYISRKQSENEQAVVRKSLARIKKPATVKATRTSTYPIPFETILTGVEQDLYSNGLQSTVYKYRERWLAGGKLQAWKSFSKALPALYPSGKMPDAPPVHALAVMSIAQKIANCEAMRSDTKVSSIEGDEPWTRDDDKFWDVVEVEEHVETEDEDEEFIEIRKDGPFQTPISILVDDNLQRQSENGSSTNDEEQNGLYRRSSLSLYDWLDRINPFSVPPLPTDVRRYSPPANKNSERATWEQRFVQHARREQSRMCPFCLKKWAFVNSETKAGHSWCHNENTNLRHRHQRESVRKQPLCMLQQKTCITDHCRVATNNFHDEGEDADIDSDGPTLHSTKTAKRLRCRPIRKQNFRPIPEPIVVPPHLRIHQRVGDDASFLVRCSRKRRLKSIDSIEVREGRKRRKSSRECAC